jgi:hypothetical protein
MLNNEKENDMAFKAVFLSTVPTDETLHFNQTEFGLMVARRAQQLLVKYKKNLVLFRAELSGLTLTTELVFDHEVSYRSMMEELNIEFPTFDEKRFNHITKNNIEIQVSESEV